STPPPTAPLFPYTTLFRSSSVPDPRCWQYEVCAARSLISCSGSDRDRRKCGRALRRAEFRLAISPEPGQGSGVPDHGPELGGARTEEHTSELQSRENLVCR